MYRKWPATIIAVVSIAFGFLALGKPYWTLENTPIWLVLVMFLVVLWRGPVTHRAAISILAISLAACLVISRELSVALLVYGALVYLGLSGLEAISKMRTRTWHLGVLGAGMLLLAILGTYWVDVASILTGLLIGPGLIVASVMMLLEIWRKPRARQSGGHPWALSGRIGAVALLLFSGLLSILTYQAILAEPTLDAFTEYNDPPGSQPGMLLRSMPFSRGIPDNAKAMRILYTTTGHDGEIVLATGLVLTPKEKTVDPMPVILWAHGTTGIAVTCAPSLLADPLKAGALEFADLPLDQGWAIVAPDYLGLGATAPHPYMVGAPTAQSSLDAVRAARQLDGVSLSDDTVVWGHSQGGGTAIWIGIEQATYAPDVPILGIAAMAPATNLPEFAETLLGGPLGPIFGGYVLYGYAGWYDDVDLATYIRPGARFSQEKIVSRCLAEPSFIANLASLLIREPYTQADPNSGPLYDRLQENIPNQPFGLPLMIAQGDADVLVVPTAQHGFVAQLCDAGQVVDYRIYPGLGHIELVKHDSPLIADLMTWTTARFAGEPVPDTCTTTGD